MEAPLVVWQENRFFAVDRLEEDTRLLEAQRPKWDIPRHEQVRNPLRELVPRTTPEEARPQ